MTEAEQTVVEPEREFDIAVSFAGEDREYVEDVVERVKEAGFNAFYDDDHLGEAWGQDGIEYFTNVYQNRARYVVMFVSRHYADKMWTRQERRAAMARAMTERREYILPVRLDDTALDGLLPTTIYVDANRVGLDRLVALIKEKLDGNPPARPTNILLDGKVPRSQEAIDAMIAERPDYWEYLLYAGLLRLNVDALAEKRRDHEIGYAARNSDRVDRGNVVEYAQAALADALRISANFGSVLDHEVQEAAFGKPGEPGDPDRIVHMAQRFVSVYEDFMDWAARLRGASVSGEHARTALQVLAKVADGNVTSLSDFVDKFVEEADTMSERVAAGEHLRLEMTVVIAVDNELLAEFERELELSQYDD